MPTSPRAGSSEATFRVAALPLFHAGLVAGQVGTADARRAHARWMSFLAAGWNQRLGPSTLLPCPYTRGAVRIGVDRLRRLADAVEGPVGLKNMPVALCLKDALEQGEFLAEALAPVDGFLVLDVQNLWTQAQGLGLHATRLFESYPLERVREIHVSGDSGLELLAYALGRCPEVEVVIVAERGESLGSPEARATFEAEAGLSQG
jgi:hypothetical protein